jgi:hypothetical protein
MPGVTSNLAVVIANGAAISNAIRVAGIQGGTFHMPAAWTAAAMGFQVSPSMGGTYTELWSGGARVNLTVAAGVSYALPEAAVNAAYIKFWSQNAGVDANQGAERTFSVDVVAR